MTRPSPASLVAALLFAPLLAGEAPAQSVATYNFDMSNGVVSSADPNLAATTVANGAGVALDYGRQLLPDGVTPAYATPVLRAATAGTGAVTNSEAGAIAADRYFTVTLTPTAGNRLNLTSLSFDAARGGAAEPRSFFLFADAGGTPFAAGNAVLAADVPTARPTLTSYTADLSAARFQNLTGPTEFRFYTSTPATGQSVEIDSIVFSGAVVPVPEPATALGVAALALAGWRGRRLLLG